MRLWRVPAFAFLGWMLAAAPCAPVRAAPPQQQKATLMLAFEGDGATLLAEARARLQALAAKIPPDESRVEIRAWGSAAGASDMDARRLSLTRAMTARNVLVGQGVALNRITMRPLGRMPAGGANNQLEILYRGAE